MLPERRTLPRILTSRAAWLCLLIGLTAAVYAPNLRDYFVGDDFDLIGSCFGRPPSYFLRLLVDNVAGDAWKDWGLDAAHGRGYLRPMHIWLMKLDSMIWGMQPLGFHLTATAFFVTVVVLVFLILESLGVRRPTAFLAAFGLAIHPIFSAIVPFISAREETVSATFGLAAFYFFLRHRRRAASPIPVLVCYALALLTKEAAVAWLALPFGYDVIFGTFASARAKEARLRLIGLYGGQAALMACYMAMRWIAFGNFVGGDAGPTHYFSLAAFTDYHARFWRLLLHVRHFDDHGVRALRWIAPATALAIVALSFRRSGAAFWPRRVLFFGPYWYLCATVLFYGIYYDDRHHAFVIVGLALLFGLATDAVTANLGRAGRAALLCLAFATATALWLPATLRNAREFQEAGRATARAREAIEALTARLPDGSAVRLVNTPLQAGPPFYFGWGLQAALRQPFTPSDCSKRLTIIDQEDLLMNRRTLALPRQFDLEIHFRRKPAGVVRWVRRGPLT